MSLTIADLDNISAPKSTETVSAELVSAKINELKDMLLTDHPQMPILLRTIHTQLRSDPVIVTLLTDDQIGTIVAGLHKQTGVTISAKIMSSKKSASKLTVDDL